MKTNRIKSSVNISKKQFNPNYLLVAIPSRGMVSCEFVSSLLAQGDPLNMSISYRFEVGGEVGESRNRLVGHALKIGAEYILFIDDDVILPTNCFNKLVYWAKKGHDVVSGVYYSKQVPPQPLIFKGRGNGYLSDWKVGDIIEDADGIGMGITLIKTSVFRNISKPWFKSVVNQKEKNREEFISVDESLYFCDKLELNGIKILIDTSIQGIHFDSNSKTFFFNSNGEPVVVRDNKVINNI
ncbi:TPA: hypothetical protein DCP77_01305 [Candidatus Collierbacteria bacterium]|uniref:Glycosyltransferase 2-like domain-containing protein n=1 Tax=Candidatus Collierbacteria bacterium GW2011_GWA2_42_17 TaxID=1618378 RepID=A0A0G0Z2N5_9BACT|nr:MAG: hypothetical protein UU94_C0003G0029 [Candidatus Collierbacteria bacterium GW2011_GWB2_42_12]KKS43032.1 MAG: hypothetical protein UV06_C0003G0033 [Candidatus Collierbacteria bacterium GW2011_GWA2_42_17]KKS62913.1 MAG: hypothetical protein UV28_C0003G0011 [Candidatus Collierbacteria bacterium GW2011_GWE2_42_48]KKS63460.1 MAG: hypothetical protein UV29_C0001G0017 [Candidatus Collierbacteria bacterium GW2011_GWD2_42_50]KKS64535.1 MAG: hypothetical protein UV32_C0012G0019 [Candidatus Collie